MLIKRHTAFVFLTALKNSCILYAANTSVLARRTDIKGTLRFIPALAVMLAAVLSLGVCASADALPRETVGFDYSRQEAAAGEVG